MEYLLVLLSASSYRLLVYLKLDYLINSGYKKLIYYFVIFLFIIIPQLLMDNESFSWTFSLFFIIMIIIFTEIEIMYPSKK